MGCRFPLSTPAAAEDPRLADALYRLSREASGLWQNAPHLLARELVTQRAMRAHSKGFATREIVSFYSLGAFAGAPEALREFRHIVSVDGKAMEGEHAALAAFRRELASPDAESKQELIKSFERTCLSGAATDFGQLILLFTKPNQAKYSFQMAGDTRIGVDAAWIISFQQLAGDESLHIRDAGRKRDERLHGEISVRQGDYLPLRIVLHARHTVKSHEVRDEAKLDYTAIGGALVPISLVYSRFENDEVTLESIYRYSEWQRYRGPMNR